MSFLENSDAGTLASVVGGPIFAAEWDAKRQQLIVHSCSRQARNIKADLLPVAPQSGRIAVKIHRRDALMSPRSLEALSRITRAGAIVYDPTQIFSRAMLLVRSVKVVRQEFARDVTGYYFDASSRTVLIVAPKMLPAARTLAVQEKLAAEIQKGTGSSRSTDLAVPVRVVAALPRFSRCVPIDEASVRLLRHWRTVLKATAASVMSSGLLVGAAAEAKIADHGAMASLSVFAEGDFNGHSNGFVSTGIAFFFGEDGVRSRVELQLAQGAQSDSGPGLRIIVDLEKQVEDKPDLRRPSWATPTTAGAGPGS
jgi:hypothetical protein